MAVASVMADQCKPSGSRLRRVTMCYALSQTFSLFDDTFLCHIVYNVVNFQAL